MKTSLACVLLLSGCFRAPELVLVDRATALEQQAAGSYAELEQKLAHAGIAPRPVPLTPDQLQALGIAQPSLVDDTGTTDADRVDDLLRQHCIGEALDGTLVDTAEACLGTSDRPLAAMLITRTNEARAQLWRWLQKQRPGASGDQLRRAWTKAHAQGVVCGGWVEHDDKRWDAKKC